VCCVFIEQKGELAITIIPFADGERINLNWLDLCAALRSGHLLPKAQIKDSFFYSGNNTVLNRVAWIAGLGMSVKTATVFPENPTAGLPMVNGSVSLFSDRDGTLSAILDFHLVTKWKTAGDSLLAAMQLARKDSNKILIVGAGTVGRSLYEAYSAGFPDAQFTVWSRTRANAEKMAANSSNVKVADDLESAVRSADIITSATMSTNPLINGEWLQPGQHVDLIGAYRPDMREVDDRALTRSRIFVDSFETTVDHIGEISIPLRMGTISRSDLLADYYDLSSFRRQTDEEITLFKNGGGAHLDLMTASYILKTWQAAIA
jgi:ornithine cyclodeaminase